MPVDSSMIGTFSGTGFTSSAGPLGPPVELLKSGSPMNPEVTTRILSPILEYKGLVFGCGIERESEGSAGRRNADSSWFTGGEEVGFTGNS